MSEFYDAVVAMVDAVKTDDRSLDTDEYASRVLDALPLLKIELLHMRDPDSDCTNELFIEGAPMLSFVEEDIDPGKGYEASDWADRVKETASIESYSPEFKKAVMLGLGESNNSPYITGI